MSVLARQAHVAGGAGVADSRFERQVIARPTSHCSAGGGRNAQRLRPSRHETGGTAVPHRAPVEVPVAVEALGGRCEPGGLGVVVAEVLSTRVLRRHQVSTVVLVDRRERRRGGPLRRRRSGKQRLYVILPSASPRAVDFAKSSNVPRRLLQVVPGLVAHAAGLDLAVAAEVLAGRVHERAAAAAELGLAKGRRELLGHLVAGELGEEERARVADERPAAGARDEGSESKLPVPNLQVLGLQHFRRDHGVGVFS